MTSRLPGMPEASFGCAVPANVAGTEGGRTVGGVAAVVGGDGEVVGSEVTGVVLEVVLDRVEGDDCATDVAVEDVVSWVVDLDVLSAVGCFFFDPAPAAPAMMRSTTIIATTHGQRFLLGPFGGIDPGGGGGGILGGAGNSVKELTP
jgi:hypothetical protein